MDNALVECEQDECPVSVEVGVLEQGHEPPSKPVRFIYGISIVTIATGRYREIMHGTIHMKHERTRGDWE